MNILAQATQSSALPFFERLMVNQTLRNTSLAGWLTLAGGIFGGIVLGKLAQSMLRTVARHLQERNWRMRSIVVSSFAGPANLALIGAGISIGIGKLAPSEQLSAAAAKGLGLLYIASIGWLLYNLADLIDAALRDITSKTESKLDDQLVPLVTKTLRIFLTVLIVLFVAENIFDANISAWLAGLGIAGLAVSLAAQDSIKNVFGSITILIDQPFSQGDFVTIGDATGTIEEVGFRSTRLRTVEGSVVTIPNSKVADANINNLSRRPAIRRVIDVTITYSTPPEKVAQAAQILRDILAEPEIAGAFDMVNLPPRVYFDNFNTDSLNIKVFYWFAPVDYWKFLEHGEKVNHLILLRFAQARISMAFPTRTLYLASDPEQPLMVRTAS